jgi:hypothetical protein
VAVLVAKANRIQDLKPLLPKLLALLPDIPERTLVRVGD